MLTDTHIAGLRTATRGEVIARTDSETTRHAEFLTP